MRKKESMPRETSTVKGFNRFLEQVRPLYVIDHAGRAGNGFFQTLFDEHPEVLSIPWIHYCTSYFITEFGEDASVDSRKFHQFWTSKSYFRFFYNELDEDDRNLVYRFGGNSETSIDRIKVRETFDQLILGKASVERKEAIYASFYAIAKGLGRDIEKIKLLILTDSISLRKESVFDGFSGRIVDVAIKDSSEAIIIHLTRDPRAGFASSNHQFINQLGNMYAINSLNVFGKLKDLLQCRFSMEGPFVFAFWTLYFIETFRAIEKKKKEYSASFLTVLNEDLNLDFIPTMESLCRKLDVTLNPIWSEKNYSPSMLGAEWKGTGGYSNRYQNKLTGPLQNDPSEVSETVTGPNAYVTQRWKKRLSKNEIFILEYFFRNEINTYDYEFLSSKPFGKSETSIWLKMFSPLRGEIPSLHWLARGWQKSPRAFADRLVYYLCLPAFFLLGRLVFLMSKKTRRILF
jgi:hypothetical protein